MQPLVVLDEAVETHGCLRTCRNITRLDLLQNPDKDVVAEVEKFGHGVNVTREEEWITISGS